MEQVWHDLLFAHWPLEAERLRPLVPSELTLDTFEGRAWVGVVPFRMSGIRGHGLPPLPGWSRFPELNVRTYVTYEGKPGVYFFSLDAANRAAVCTARRFYHLPYFFARMTCEAEGDWIVYDSQRHRSHAEYRGRYRPTRPPQLRSKGSLEHWLTERYCLYTVWSGRVFRGEIHHAPWPLQDAEAEIEADSMATAAGIELPASSPLLHFARRLEVLIWPLRRA